MRDNITSLRKHDIQPIGVNPGEEASHRQFRSDNDLPFELLVDEHLEVAKQYGAVNDEGTSNARSVVVVGKNGKVIFAELGAPAMQRVVNAANSATDGS